MKKILAIVTAVVLTFCCTAAFAEVVTFQEDSTDFNIQMELPEGATVGEQEASELVSVCEIQSEGLADVYITIAPSDIYDKLSMNDLSDEDVDSLVSMATAQYDNPEVNIEITPSGNKYIHVNSDAGIDSVFTLYLGYFVELTQWHEDYSAITDADYAFMLQLLHNIEFLPVE
ncbi:MAG: hypothetical protein PHY64_05620 [Eubacteriales bacterium]|nr:hypothetical protein [Eubacteriales bacterium]